MLIDRFLRSCPPCKYAISHAAVWRLDAFPLAAVLVLPRTMQHRCTCLIRPGEALAQRMCPFLTRLAPFLLGTLWSLVVL
eukprot:4906427-Amphidinium_carterae.1